MQSDRATFDIAKKLYGFTMRQVVAYLAVHGQNLVSGAQTAIFGGLSARQYRLYEDTCGKLKTN